MLFWYLLHTFVMSILGHLCGALDSPGHRFVALSYPTVRLRDHDSARRPRCLLVVAASGCREAARGLPEQGALCAGSIHKECLASAFWGVVCFMRAFTPSNLLE